MGRRSFNSFTTTCRREERAGKAGPARPTFRLLSKFSYTLQDFRRAQFLYYARGRAEVYGFPPRRTPSVKPAGPPTLNELDVEP